MASSTVALSHHQFLGHVLRRYRYLGRVRLRDRWLRLVVLLVSFLSLGTMPLVQFLSASPVYAVDWVAIHDDLGRLRAVIDPATEVGLYTYDAVGNLLRIERRSAALLSLIEFSPKCGPSSSTTVTLYGTAFSPTASQNTVRFNGIATTTTAATSTTLVAPVPGGATTGLISVTTSSGTTNSSQAFIVGTCP